MTSPEVRLIPFGPDAVLVEVDGPEAAVSLAAWARGRVAAREVVPAARTVLFDGDVPDDLAALLAEWTPGEAVGGELVDIPVEYDGPDLAAVAERWRMSVAEAVRTHLAGEYVVAFCGFAPGFPYLTGLPEALAVPRLDAPRSRVEPGSVGLAGAFTGIYPSASPGGWQLIGRTDAVLWDVARAEPALLTPGTRVRFVAAP